MTCQIDVVNKQLVPPLSWNNPFSETLMVYLQTRICWGKIYYHVKNTRMLWIWFCPVITKELFLQMSVNNRQTKSLKTTCEVVSFHYIYKLYKWNFSQKVLPQAFLKGFAKITCDVLLYRTVKNLIIYGPEAFKYFSHYEFITLFPFSYHIFGAAFFYEDLPVIVLANTWLTVAPKKLK